MERLDRIEYYLIIAAGAALRSTCDRARVGCVITDEEHHVFGIGYNGALSGHPHCDSNIGHFMVAGHCIRTVHAEQNAILRSLGPSKIGLIAYCTHQPCFTCCKLLYTFGVRTIHWVLPFPDSTRTAYFTPDRLLKFIQHTEMETSPWYQSLTQKPNLTE